MPYEQSADLHRDARGNIFEEDIRIFEDGREKRRDREDDRTLVRRRSLSRPPPPRERERVESKREETNINVNIDADFGGVTDRRVGRPAPPLERPRPREMWTEVTKDLVAREAILEMGYQFEETEEFYYVMNYLIYVSLVFWCWCYRTMLTNVV